jgi:hypothetical protein
MQKTVSGLPPSPNLSPKEERNMRGVLEPGLAYSAACLISGGRHDFT